MSPASRRSDRALYLWAFAFYIVKLGAILIVLWGILARITRHTG